MVRGWRSVCFVRCVPPKKPFDPLLFARWRCWKEYGTGVAGDLLVHLISGMQFVLGINEIPKRVAAFGGIYRWNDGRNMPDVHPVLFEYANVPVYMRLSLGTESTEVTRFMGSKGIIELTEFGVTYTPLAGVDLSPSYYAGSFPSRLREAYYSEWHTQHHPAWRVLRFFRWLAPDRDGRRAHGRGLAARSQRHLHPSGISGPGARASPDQQAGTAANATRRDAVSARDERQRRRPSTVREDGVQQLSRICSAGNFAAFRYELGRQKLHTEKISHVFDQIIPLVVFLTLADDAERSEGTLTLLLAKIAHADQHACVAEQRNDR